MASQTADESATGSNLNTHQLYPNSTEKIVLLVGDRKFVTTPSTLCLRSKYFQTFFSGDWIIPRDEEGNIFYDGDPDVFEYVLKYMRRGIFPVVHDPQKGHDYNLYTAILAEAKYLQLPLLEFWIQEEGYILCLKSSIQASTPTNLGHQRGLRSHAFDPELPWKCTLPPNAILLDRNPVHEGDKIDTSDGDKMPMILTETHHVLTDMCTDEGYVFCSGERQYRIETRLLC